MCKTWKDLVKYKILIFDTNYKLQNSFFLILTRFILSIYRRAKPNPVEHVKDILIQEIMTLEKSVYEQEAIDMDSISFAGMCIF